MINEYFYWRDGIILDVTDEIYGSAKLNCFVYNNEWFYQECRIYYNENGKVANIQALTHMKRIGPKLVEELKKIERKEKLRKLLT